RPGDGPHALQQVAHLLRRVVEELRDDLHGARGEHHREHHGEVDREAGDALARGETLPGARLDALEDRAHSSSTWPFSRNTPRTQVASTSPTMIMAMIDSRIAATKS